LNRTYRASVGFRFIGHTAIPTQYGGQECDGPNISAAAPAAVAAAQVITVGLGSPENARIFSSTLDFPLDGLYADPTGACYSALGFSPGFAPGADINPYLKLLPMLAGIGSPGTLQEVS
jgi:hypothetical protein